MTTHQAVFGDVVCAIEIEPRPVVDAGIVYVATPYVVDDVRHVHYWFENGKGRPVEIFGATEEHALEAAMDYVAQHEGPRQGPPRTTSFSTAPVRLCAMRKRRRNIRGSGPGHETEVVLTAEEVKRSTQSLLVTRQLPFFLESVDVDETVRVIRLLFRERGGDFISVDCPITATREDVKRSVVRRLQPAVAVGR
jgi:hypothetical protein